MLSWGLAELLTEIDIPMVGVAEADAYQTWVVNPALPDGIQNLGMRNEPNLELLAALEPDLILATDLQAQLMPQLARIAPTAFFEAFTHTHDNAAASRADLLTLARAFSKGAQAEKRLGELDAQLAAAGDRVRAAFFGDVPPVLPIRLLTPTSLRLHGTNSMMMAALEAMGLTHADPGPNSNWGFRQLRVSDLAQYEQALIVHVDLFPQHDELFSSPLWQAMPFVQSDRFATADPAWTFGGVFSLGYLGDTLADALVRLGSQTP